MIFLLHFSLSNYLDVESTTLLDSNITILYLWFLNPSSLYCMLYEISSSLPSNLFIHCFISTCPILRKFLQLTERFPLFIFSMKLLGYWTYWIDWSNLIILYLWFLNPVYAVYVVYLPIFLLIVSFLLMMPFLRPFLFSGVCVILFLFYGCIIFSYPSEVIKWLKCQTLGKAFMIQVD